MKHAKLAFTTSALVLGVAIAGTFGAVKGADGQLQKTPQPVLTAQPVSTAHQAIGSDLKLVKWTVAPGNCEYTECCKITYTLHNDYPKAIKLIDAGVSFSDLLGAHIFSIKLNPEIKYPPMAKQPIQAIGGSISSFPMRLGSASSLRPILMHSSMSAPSFLPTTPKFRSIKELPPHRGTAPP